MRAALPILSLAATGLVRMAAAQDTTSRLPRDAAAWGGHHVGQPVPQYVHGDECLFCHRNDIGTTWQDDPHARTVRHREDAPELRQMLGSHPALAPVSADVEYFLGGRHDVRFLKKDGYGRFALLSSRAVLDPPGRAREWVGSESPIWDKDRFALRCAGCHTTGVDPITRTFSAFGLDCYTCHGDVDLGHANEPSRAFLSKTGVRDPRAVTSACAQCHLRAGRSRSTGLPYPNNFVAGDNLFQDFEVDLARAADAALSVGDRHVLRNVRDVVQDGSHRVTCVSCHQVHGASSVKHRWLPRSALCPECHEANLSVKARGRDHAAVCEY